MQPYSWQSAFTSDHPHWLGQHHAGSHRPYTWWVLKERELSPWPFIWASTQCQLSEEDSCLRMGIVNACREWMANALLRLDVILIKMETENPKAAPCTQGHLCSFSSKRQPKWKQKEVLASGLTATNYICPRLCIARIDGISFLEEKGYASGNCMQKYCNKKGKSSTGRNRGAAFQVRFFKLENADILCARKPPNCCLLFTTPCYSPLILHFLTSPPSKALPCLLKRY